MISIKSFIDNTIFRVLGNFYLSMFHVPCSLLVPQIFEQHQTNPVFLAVVPIVAIQVVVIVVVAVFRLQRSSRSFRSYYNFIKLVFFVTVTPDKKNLSPWLDTTTFSALTISLTIPSITITKQMEESQVMGKVRLCQVKLS